MCTAQLLVHQVCKTVKLAELASWDGNTVQKILRNIVYDELIQKDQEEVIFNSKPRSAYGKFIRTTIKKKDIFIYINSHPWNWTSSRIPYQLFQNVLEPDTQIGETTPCEESVHPFLSPFFVGSSLVAKELELWISNNADNDLLPCVKNVLEQHSHSSPSNIQLEEEEYELVEEQWTDRLHKALKCHPSYNKLETCHGIKATKFEGMKMKEVGLPRGCANMYVIKGGADLYLPGLVVTNGDDNYHPEDTDEGIATVPHTPSLSPAPASTPTPASNISFVAEHATNQPAQFPYPKMGELIANMHISHIDMIIKNDCALKPQVVNGLYICKPSGARIFKMDLDTDTQDDYVEGIFRLTCYHSPLRLLTEQVLCSALHTCTNLDLHKLGSSQM